jgi:hypothetical protein
MIPSFVSNAVMVLSTFIMQVGVAVLILVGLATVAYQNAQAADNQTFPVSLSRTERLVLEQVVCAKKFGVGVAEIDAQAFEANAANANFADVTCRPHAQLENKPLYYVAQCAREGGQWSCGLAEVETRVDLVFPAQQKGEQAEQRELRVRPGSVAPAVAVNAIKKISTYGYFQGQSVSKALQSVCNMGLGEKPDLIEIACRRWSLTVSFWCPATPEKVGCPRIIFMTPQT